MTPCEELGYKVGDLFRNLYTDFIPKGTTVQLIKDDGTEVPLFRLPTGESVYLWAEDVVPVVDVVELKAGILADKDIKALKATMATNPSTVLSLDLEANPIKRGYSTFN